MSDEQQLDRVENQMIDLRLATSALIETVPVHQRNFEVMERHIATLYQEIQEIKTEIRDIQTEIREIRLDTRGLQTENRRILDELQRRPPMDDDENGEAPA